MTKYEPKTDDVDRVGLLQWMEQSPQCSRYSKDSIKYILHDLTHAEACLKEAYEEIERLNRLVDWHINHCEKNGGECIESLDVRATTASELTRLSNRVYCQHEKATTQKRQ